MKLKNVHYEYCGNDIWRIYFKDYAEMETFWNERTDGKKPRCGALCTNNLGIRYYIDAELVGRFNILRHCVNSRINNFFSNDNNDSWRALVKKIEGADADYIFDEIDLWYDAAFDKCYFRICCMNGTCTEFFVKNMLNSQFGMVAQANGYYDTDTVGQGGLCTRRSCCGIGFDPNVHKTDTEWIMFSVKDYCPNGKADIVKVSAWTNTFIGINAENEKEYSWVDFKHYMQKLSSTGSDIWDIEWEYDETCPFTGTEIADKVHVYLKPLAYKRVFEEKEKVKMVWLSTGSLWSNDEYLGRVKALTPPPVPYWMKQDEDSKIGFRQKDKDEVQKEIDEMTKRIYEKLEIKQVKDFDTDTAWHEYLSATETAQVCEYCKRDVDICKEMADVEPLVYSNHKIMTLTEFNASIKGTNNKEEKNMEIKNVKAIYCTGRKPDKSVYYYRVYFSDLSDLSGIKTSLYYQDKSFHCWYYLNVGSTAELSMELRNKLHTVPLCPEYETSDSVKYYINWKELCRDLNGEQKKEKEATKREEKNMGPKDTTFAEYCRRLYWGQIGVAKVKPTKILIQGTATIIWWSDGTKTVVKCQKGDKMDPEKGIAMCVMKKFMGTNETHSNYLDFAKPAIKDYEAKQKAMAAARKKAADKKRRAAKKEEKGNGEA